MTPPSARSVVPVTKDESSDTRNAIRRAATTTSCGRSASGSMACCGGSRSSGSACDLRRSRPSSPGRRRPVSHRCARCGSTIRTTRWPQPSTTSTCSARMCWSPRCSSPERRSPGLPAPGIGVERALDGHDPPRRDVGDHRDPARPPADPGSRRRQSRHRRVMARGACRDAVTRPDDHLKVGAAQNGYVPRVAGV